MLAVSFSIAMLAKDATAQINLKKIGDKVKSAAKEVVKETLEEEDKAKEKSSSTTTPATTPPTTTSKSSTATPPTSKPSTSTTPSTNLSKSSTSSSASTEKVSSGKTIYVSLTNGSNRNDGSKAAPLKDIQKALDMAENGTTIKVTEGNYLGAMNAGYIEISKWITLEGGYNADFSQRDPLKYITKIEPTKEHLGTSLSKGLITISKLDDVQSSNILGTLTIDGIILNMGYQNDYKPNDPKSPENGCPSENFETGRMLDESTSHQLIRSEAAIAGNVIIRNCAFLNGNYFGIQINTRRGKIEIYNCVFVSNRFAAVRIDGWDKNGVASHVDFHHNTVAFSWCRTKHMEDMGYGYEFMIRVNGDVHHNIFLCNNYAAVARTHALSGPDAPIEAKRVTNLYDNIFFMNAADLQLPSKGGGKWTNVKCAMFEDLDEKIIPKADGNFELKSNDDFIKVIDPDYLQGFATLKVVSSSNFDGNSAANQYRAAHGMNLQGTETTRVTMFCNRYKFDYALKFFGAKNGYGAQKP